MKPAPISFPGSGWRARRSVALGLCLLAAGITARADLMLDQFSPANPIKIMCMGDSITDDCMTNGAWRRFLQPLLEANGYPFTFVGRQSSIPSTNFTQVQHEGYCGAVIGQPGVEGSTTVHGYPGNEVYLQKIAVDALTNVTPDLILLLIGVNDIGCGRPPLRVATNDMPILLNHIFSNAPNVNVIVAKVTSLQNSYIAGRNYATNATNIYTYNDALQLTVNQRRAQGQNVFIADMFSVVDYNTMYDSDHVHPNAAGLQAVAQEWLARIQSITVTTNLYTRSLITGGEVWNYSDTGQDLGTAWTQPGYDDSAWSSGTARLGYGTPAVETTVSYGASSNDCNPTTYFRLWFPAPQGVQLTNLNLRVSQADGAVVWLNGSEIYRTNMPAGPIAFTNLALGLLTNDEPYIFEPTNITGRGLSPGSNLIAAEVHISQPACPLSGFDMELIGAGYYLPPALSIAQSGGALSVSWPASNSAGYNLYWTTNLAATAWTPSTPSFTNAGQIVVTQSVNSTVKFFRLRQP
jgi:lysophospholipase L1-like esterase